MKGFRSLYVLTGGIALGYGSIFTLLPEIRDQFGFSESELGLVVFAGFAASFVAQVNLSWLADRGHAKVMVRTGLLLAAIAMLLLAVADSLWQFLVLRAVFGMASGIVGPALRRIVVSRDPDNIGENLGRMSAWDIGGFVIGPLLAGVLGVVALWLPFLVLGVWYLVLWWFVLSLDLSSTPGQGSSILSAVRLVRHRPLVASLIAAVPFYVTLGVYEALWALLLADLGAEQWFIGLSLSVFTIPMIFIAPRGGKAAQRYGPLRVVAYGVTSAALCMALYGQIGDPITVEGDQPAQMGAIAVLLVISLVHALSDGFTLPSNSVAAAIHAPDAQIASAQGLFGATGLLVAAMSALGGSWAYDQYGPGTAFGVSAIVMVSILAVGVVVGREQIRPLAPVATP